MKQITETELMFALDTINEVLETEEVHSELEEVRDMLEQIAKEPPVEVPDVHSL